MLMELLDALAYAADTPGALTRGVLAGRPGERMSGRDLFEAWGVLGQNKPGLDWGDAAGFAGDLFLDPLNLLGAGVVKNAFKGRQAAKTANVAADASNVAREGIQAANAHSELMRARGAMPEEIANLTKIVDETGKPERMLHGTPYVYDKYDMAKMDRNALYGEGIYTTNTGDIASGYTSKDVVPGYNVSGKIEEAFGDLDVDRRRAIASAISDNKVYLGEEMQAFRRSTRPVFRAMDDKKIAEMADAVGGEFGDLLRSVIGGPVAPQNVRMQYIDARNPLQMDDVVGDLMAPRVNEIVTQAMLKESPESSVRFWLNDVLEGQKIGPSHSADWVYREVLPNVTGRTTSDIVRELGYDAIQHTGGSRTGNAPHKVVIALDPSQIYKPYIAPALQAVPDLASHVPVPGVRNPLLALLGYNVAKQPGMN